MICRFFLKRRCIRFSSIKMELEQKMEPLFVNQLMAATPNPHNQVDRNTTKTRQCLRRGEWPKVHKNKEQRFFASTFPKFILSIFTNSNFFGGSAQKLVYHTSAKFHPSSYFGGQHMNFNLEKCRGVVRKYRVKLAIVKKVLHCSI